MALTCLDYITQAMLELQQLDSGADPTAEECDDGLKRLQMIVDGLFDFGVGWPLADSKIIADDTLTADTRALVFATNAIALTFPEDPVNGDRIRIKDMSGNFATYNVTIDPNYRQIEGASSLTLNTDNEDRTWLYVADSAGWVRVSDLELSDTLNLGDDEFFVLELADRMSAMFGTQLSADSRASLVRAANRIRARFASHPVIPADSGVRFLSSQSYDSSRLRNGSF